MSTTPYERLKGTLLAQRIEREAMTAALAAERSLRHLREPIRIPLVGNQEAVLNGTFPMTEDGWGGFMNCLYALKQGLVFDPADDPEPEPDTTEESK